MRNKLYLIIFLILIFSKPFTAQEQNLTKVQNRIKLNTNFINLSKSQWQFVVEVVNNGGKTIYLATEPVMLKGEKGYYLFLDENDKTFLNVSSRVFGFQTLLPPLDKTSVKLIKLSPNEKYVDKIIINLPTKETSPPWGVISEDVVMSEGFSGKLPVKNEIDPKKIKVVRISFGYFIEEQGIIDFLDSKPQGWYINGAQRLISGKFAGKQFNEIQDLLFIEVPI